LDYRRLLQVLSTLSLGLLLCNCASAQSTRVYRVLVISSLQQGVPWNMNAMATFEHTLMSSVDETNEELELHVDYMHTKRIRVDKHYLDFKSGLLADEFHKLRHNLVICIGSDALSFMLSRGDNIFPDVPVLFCAVGTDEAARARQKPLYEGISGDWNLGENIKLALNLFPDTKQVVFVHDNTTSGNASAIDALAFASKYPDVDFRFVTDETMPRVLDKVRQLPKDSTLFILPFSIDKDGEFFVSDSGMRKIISVSNTPSFGLWKYLTNNGIIGGLLIDEGEYGKTIAKCAIRILRAGGFRGVKVPCATPARYIFDWEQLHRFKPRAAGMPSDYVVVNRQENFIATYKVPILAGLSILVFFAGLGVTLSINTLRRMRAEEALRVSEERLNLAVNATSDGIWDWNIDTGSIYCSPRCSAVLGCESDEMHGMLTFIQDLVDSEDAKSASEALQAHLENSSSSYQAEYRVKTKQGDCRWVSAQGKVVERNQNGMAMRMVGTITDITVRKQAEQEQLEYERKLDEQKRQFYRETILSVTGGKFRICQYSEIDEFIERAEVGTFFDSMETTSNARKDVESFIRSKGLDEDRTSLIMMGVGEAITNVIKHACDGGEIFAGADNKGVWAVVRDKGDGIESLLIPKVVLMQGYSTKPSLGYGYSIMLDVSDRILLATGDAGTSILLMKYFTDEPMHLLINQDDPKAWSEELGD
jgi:PAS domain S-box-containing protein